MYRQQKCWPSQCSCDPCTFLLPKFVKCLFKWHPWLCRYADMYCGCMDRPGRKDDCWEGFGEQEDDDWDD